MDHYAYSLLLLIYYAPWLLRYYCAAITVVTQLKPTIITVITRLLHNHFVIITRRVHTLLRELLPPRKIHIKNNAFLFFPKRK